jgi:hypothetical protein
MATNQPSLPTDRVFFVQLYDEAQVEQDQFSGRVEHIVSGTATHFASVEGLVAFITHVLTAQSASDDGHGST